MSDSTEMLSRRLTAAALVKEGAGAARAEPARDAGAERWRRIAVSTGSSLAARAVAMACNLLTVPLALRYLGTAHYGVWVTLTSAVNMLSSLDCGLGIGLQNRVAELMGRERLDEAADSIRSTMAVLVGIAAAAALLLGGLVFATDLPHAMFARAPLGPAELRAVIAIVVGGFVLSLPLTVFSRAAIGLQQGWISNLAATTGTALTLVGVVLAAWWELGFAAFVAVSIVPRFGTQAAAYFLVRRRLPGGLPVKGRVSWREGVRTLRQGGRYVLPQVGGLVLTQSPLFLLGTLASPASATIYAVLSRISVPLQQVQQMFLSQVWPAITEAMHRGDERWLGRTLRRLLRLNIGYSGLLLVGTAGGVLVLFPLLTRSTDLRPGLGLILLYAAHVAVMSLVQGVAYVANGLSRVRHQNYFALVGLVCAVTVFPLAVTRYDIAGVLVALLLLNLCAGLPLLWRDYRSYRASVHPDVTPFADAR